MFCQIREETETRVELPNEHSDSDVIRITGRKENVLQAKMRIEAIQKELVRSHPHPHTVTSICPLQVSPFKIQNLEY